MDDFLKKYFAKEGIIFWDIPKLVDGKANLFDSRQESLFTLPDKTTLTQLEIEFSDTLTSPLDKGLILLLFVGDIDQPKVRIRLFDLMELGGKQPLNLTKHPNQVVLLLLEDQNGAWRDNSPDITIKLR